MVYLCTRNPAKCGNSSVGRAQPCQGWGREFESRFPLKTMKTAFSCLFSFCTHGELCSPEATPLTPFRGRGCKYKFASNCPRAAWARVSFSAQNKESNLYGLLLRFARGRDSALWFRYLLACRLPATEACAKFHYLIAILSKNACGTLASVATTTI